MKKLINVSPFMLLMVPVFAVMALSFTATKSSNDVSSVEIASKNKVESNSVVKIISTIKN